MKHEPKSNQFQTLRAAMNDFQRQYIMKVMQQTPTLEKAEEALGLGTGSLYSMMKRLGIKRTVKVTKTVQISLVPKKPR